MTLFRRLRDAKDGTGMCTSFSRTNDSGHLNRNEHFLSMISLQFSLSKISCSFRVELDAFHVAESVQLYTSSISSYIL